MNKRTLLTIATVIAASVAGSVAGELDDIKAAAGKLSEAANYSWSTTIKVPEGTRFGGGATQGKIDKDGTMEVRTTRRDTVSVAIIQGEKAALTDQDGNWQSVAEVENSEGFGRFRAMTIRSTRSPSDEAMEIAAAVTEWKTEDGVLSGELSKEGAKELMQFRRGRRGGDGGQGGPEIFGAVGNAKFWIKDGVLQKYEYHVEGLMEFNGNDRDIDRTTTVEIKDIGSTKIEIPEAAKAKLS